MEVYQGVYTGGRRTGQKMVAKRFINRAVFEARFFDAVLDVTEKALELLKSFNAAKIIKQTVRLNMPEIRTFGSQSRFRNELFLAEPFIPDYQKFNSNSGWVLPSTEPWNQLLQALTHHSYHISGGQFVLCDLQGGYFRDGVVLTDPAIHSLTKRFGPADLGPRGMLSVFHNHRCSAYCRREWQLPKNTAQYYRVSMGSTLE
ncbi:kinase-like domain-containing protein [Hyaloraphidium curvatum]|nr:kinase-like domain-containing protein [Hyaloraphidium curvatum]